MKIRRSIPALATATAVALSAVTAPQAFAVDPMHDYTTSWNATNSTCIVNYGPEAQRAIKQGQEQMVRQMEAVGTPQLEGAQWTYLLLALGVTAGIEPGKPTTYTLKDLMSTNATATSNNNQDLDAQAAVTEGLAYFKRAYDRSPRFQDATKIMDNAKDECRLNVILPATIVPVVVLALVALAWPTIKQAIPALQGLPF